MSNKREIGAAVLKVTRELQAGKAMRIVNVSLAPGMEDPREDRTLSGSVRHAAGSVRANASGLGAGAVRSVWGRALSLAYRAQESEGSAGRGAI